MAMPEGEKHLWGKVRAVQMLKNYYERERRQVFVGAEMAVYYPGERRFAPDVLAVVDVEVRERDKWVVSAEGKGLDWVLEVHVGGDRKKDAEYNVRRYARLGVREYFIYDRARERLEGYRLPFPGAGRYERMEPRAGRYESEVLGLGLQVEEEELYFWARDERLMDLEELLESAERRADVEVLRREEAERRREEAERNAAELRAELERLRGQMRR
jgi:Uma2 family endonuclease